MPEHLFFDILCSLFNDDVYMGHHRSELTCGVYWPHDPPEGLEEIDEDWGDYSPNWYLDGTPVVKEERPCDHCHLVADSHGTPDPCLGTLDGVQSACCGHGWSDKDDMTPVPYVSLEGPERGEVLRRGEALDWFAERGVGPELDQWSNHA